MPQQLTRFIGVRAVVAFMCCGLGATTAAAQAPSVPADPLVRENATTRLSPHVFVIPDNNVGLVPNVGIIVGDRATLVIDTGLGPRNGATVVRETATPSPTPRLFQPVLVADRDIRFFSASERGRTVGLAVANRSDDGPGAVVGISNIVLTGDEPEAQRRGAVAAIRATFPGLPMVGYERGDDLAAMIALGFRSLGPFRVWRSPT